MSECVPANMVKLCALGCVCACVCVCVCVSLPLRSAQTTSLSLSMSAAAPTRGQCTTVRPRTTRARHACAVNQEQDDRRFIHMRRDIAFSRQRGRCKNGLYQFEVLH